MAHNPTIQRKPIVMGELPEPPGPWFFLRRMGRGCPWVPCQVTYDPAEGYRIMEDGVWSEPVPDPWLHPMGERVLLSNPSTEAEVKFRIGLKRWAEVYAPDHAAANPRRAINFDSFTPI
jgi:hypothetical protein